MSELFRILIKNANVFNGRKSELNKNVNIIIEKNLVKEIIKGAVSEEGFDSVIDARNSTVIPGLVDNHVHLAIPFTGEERLDELVIKGTRIAKQMLYRGFTTVRDAGGVVYGIKKGIDDGEIEGPRIFPSHGIISQTSGHGDARESRAHLRLADGEYTSPNLRTGGTVLADGTAEVLRAVRQQLFLGASQIKIMAGGGMSSQYDPIDTVQFTLEEMQAAVSAAKDYGTYVMAHLYTNESMQRAAKAGVRSFEHGHLMNEETAKIISDNHIFLCSCPQFSPNMKKSDENPNSLKSKKLKEMFENATKLDELISKYNIPTIFGTDYMDAYAKIYKGVEEIQLKDLNAYKERFGSYRGLVSATGNAYELTKLTTYQNPYPDGKIGVLEQGSYADILIIEGNPLEDLNILTDKNNIKLIMKDAKIYKNTLI